MGLHYGGKLGTHMSKRMQAKVADTFKPHTQSGTHHMSIVNNSTYIGIQEYTHQKKNFMIRLVTGKSADRELGKELETK